MAPFFSLVLKRAVALIEFEGPDEPAPIPIESRHPLPVLTADTQRSRLLAFAGIACATLVAAWLRTYQVQIQIVQDDEWHAIHKLLTSSGWQIIGSFGRADHSIPLTLLYKAMAGWVGLDEVNMRAIQIAAGIGAVPLLGMAAFRMTRNPAASVTFAWLVALSPLLVLYSRLARPYSLTTLTTTASLILIWLWRTRRHRTMAAAVCGLVALGAWLHPVSAVFPAVALLYVLAEDARTRASVVSTLLLGFAAALSILVPLSAPLLLDWGSLAAKTGGDHPSLMTFARTLSFFSGGLPSSGTLALCALATFGCSDLFRKQTRVAAYLVALFLGPIAVLSMLGAPYINQGHTLSRYLFPAELIFLFWAAWGTTEVVRRYIDALSPLLGALMLAGLVTLLAFASPTVRQVATLGPWYGHALHHFDYDPQYNVAARQFDSFVVPAFYRWLGGLRAGQAPIIEAPFSYNAPGNVIAYFSLYHRQPQLAGMLHDLCLSGDYVGEVPGDSRFKFHEFLFLSDPESVRSSGARFLLLHLDIRQGVPFVEAGKCLGALKVLYGPPVITTPMLAVFDLRPDDLPAIPRDRAW